MRAIEMLKSNDPIPEERVRVFELSIGADLPSDYHNWILASNGGIPSGSNNFIHRDRFDPPLRSSVGVQWFLSLDEIADARKTYGHRIESDLIPIAEDGDGNLVCIALFGEERGRVFFWDHELEPAAFELLGETSYISNVTKIADDFSDFLNKLGNSPGFPAE
jgi:SMI1 / KNR4 family (SUKH-1)